MPAVAVPLTLGQPAVAVGAQVAPMAVGVTSGQFTVPLAATMLTISLDRTGFATGRVLVTCAISFNGGLDGYPWSVSVGADAASDNATPTSVILPLPISPTRQAQVTVAPQQGAPTVGAASITVS